MKLFFRFLLTTDIKTGVPSFPEWGGPVIPKGAPCKDELRGVSTENQHSEDMVSLKICPSIQISHGEKK